jgi:hypothetical protein
MKILETVGNMGSMIYFGANIGKYKHKFIFKILINSFYKSMWKRKWYGIIIKCINIYLKKKLNRKFPFTSRIDVILFKI